jgi:hypothetical protein
MLDGDRYRMSFLAEQLGTYRHGEGPDALAFAVNPPPDESDLRSMDLALLPKRAGENQQAHFVEGQSDFEALNRGRPVFHYFVFGVLALLLAELLVQILVRPTARPAAPSASSS